MRILVSIAACLAMLCVVAPTTVDAADYVGAKKCKMCHKKAHAKWMETGHSKAFDRLEGADAENPECIGCHTTGYSGSGPVDDTQKHVQCEACHGPGSDYRKVMMKKKTYTFEAAQAAGLRKPDKEGKFCQEQCHNEKNPNHKPFDFAERFPKIQHTLDKPRAK